MGAFLTYVSPPEVVVINRDHGGVVSLYEEMVAKYISEGRRIEITGMCSSACTLALSSPKTCVTKTAQAAWHHAYDPDTHALMPHVTQRMIQNLPKKLKYYLEDKIQRDYTPETILNYDKLVSLGVKSCDGHEETRPVWTAKSETSTVTAKVNLPEEEFPASKNNKSEEWSDYWGWAQRASKEQFGRPLTVDRCFEDGVCSKSVYYYDRKRQYVSAVEFYKGQKVTDRIVCRSASETSKTMTCVGWHDQNVVKYFQDPKSGEYFEARQASR